jgi:hypothetical protein
MAKKNPLASYSGRLQELGSGDWADAKLGVAALTNSSGTVTLDASLDALRTLTLAANVSTLTITNVPASGLATVIAILIAQNGTGGFTFALPASLKQLTGSDSAIQSAANAKTLLMIMTFDQGTTWQYVMRASA